MAQQYGVTKAGFVVKPFQAILADKFERARAMFGSDADLRSTSALRKLLEIPSFEDQELWKAMEALYYSNFLSTASGDALDLLGEDLGVARRFLPASGTVKFTLAGAVPGRVYNLPVGALVETDPPVKYFRTTERISLSAENKTAVAAVVSTVRGVEGNAPAQAVKRIDADYAKHYLNLGAASVAVENAAPIGGGSDREPDDSYRALLLGRPRTLWTLEAVRHEVANVDGVRDCRLFDPMGGVDVSQSRFNLFVFGQRKFGRQRLLLTPYFFDVLIAVQPGYLWETEGGVAGVRERVEDAIREVRPVSIFPNLRLANNVLIGIRAKVLVRAGHDRTAVAASIKDRLENRVNALGLGSSVLYSETMRDCMDVPGVVDVQQLHLRRCPPVFSTIHFGSTQFRTQVIEAAEGENIPLQPDEIAVFRIDSELIDIGVSDR